MRPTLMQLKGVARRLAGDDGVKTLRDAGAPLKLSKQAMWNRQARMLARLSPEQRDRVKARLSQGKPCRRSTVAA